MSIENIYKIFSNNFCNYLQKESGRTNLFSRCIRALLNTKLDKIKF